MLANRILGVITTILAWPTLPVQLVTTSVGGCLVSLTFGLLLIPITIIWQLFFWPLLGLSWAWDRVPLLRIPLAIIGIPLAALGTTYVALMPSMGDMGSRVTKLVICGTWPFSLDYFRSHVRGIEPDYDRLVRIKQVMRSLRVGPDPDDSVWEGSVYGEDGTLIAAGPVPIHLTTSLAAESRLVGELRQPGIGQLVGTNRSLTIRTPYAEFSLTEFEVESAKLKFQMQQSDLKVVSLASRIVHEEAAPSGDASGELYCSSCHRFLTAGASTCAYCGHAT
jgi:hypothetical protein